MMISRTHRNCGGKIVNRKCQKCGKKFGLIKYFVTKDIIDKVDKFDPGEYRKRIREGRDIP